MRRSKVIFPNISSRSWEHPADRAALSALQSVPGLDLVVRKVIGATTERSLRLVALSSSVRVSERQFAKVHTLLREACHILDIKNPPEMYISASPFVNARIIGVERPFIILNSSLLDTLSDEELLAVIAHELGHYMSGHMLYSTLLVLLTNFTMPVVSSLPLGNVAIAAITMALMEWYRKSELSCDRAGLLVVQDPDVCYTLEMKLAGGAQVAEMNINEFFAQAYEYESGGTMIDSMHKILNLLGKSHPFPVLRLVELKKWVDSGDYTRILNGGFAQHNDDTNPRAYHAPKYATNEDTNQETVADSIKTAAKKYKEEFASSTDPLVSKVNDLADSATDAAMKFADYLKNNLGK
jgi:Zn-dependent protease with chaperone function